jgi:hypothetical protein
MEQEQGKNSGLTSKSCVFGIELAETYDSSIPVLVVAPDVLMTGFAE